MDSGYDFLFSVVMAVYNVEPFLNEAVDSLVNQTIGFNKIQLIMVDDGSTDRSGSICDEYAAKYPDNIVVIHKENGGVSSARNEGLKYATGRYLNFMDSDDKFTRNAFSSVYKFFVKNEDEVDVVTIPLEFFDAQHGSHWQNGKFKCGTRVLDLYWDYQATIMFVNASFFSAHIKDSINFDSHLVCGEDMKVLLSVLIRKMKLGVVTGGKYMYRRRSVGEASLIQAAKKKYGWYFDYFTYLIDWAVEFYFNHFGYLPAFLQYELLCDLQWRFGEIYDMSDVLTAEEIEQYKARLFSSLRYFDDKYILEQKMIWAEHKCYMLSKKYGRMPTLSERHSNVIVHFENTKLPSFADQYSKIEFIRIENSTVIIEGFTKVFGVDLSEPLSIYLECNSQLIPCEIIPRDPLNEYRFDELIFRGIEFRGRVPLTQEFNKYSIRLVLQYRNTKVVKRDIRFGKFTPITRKYANSYYYKNGYMVTVSGNRLNINLCSRKARFKREYKFLKELWKANRTGTRKAVFARLAYHILKYFKQKEIWLVSDRIMKADDNGEAFFRYMQGNRKKNIKTYFVLSKESVDYTRMQQVGPTVDALSFKHKLLHLLCDYNISAHADKVTINPFSDYQDSYRDILAESKYVFLQHGIIKDDISGWLNRYNKNISGFITAAIPEYYSILNEDYFYTEKEVWLTGLPRFDRLYHDEKKYITIAPTWREYLMQGMDDKTGIWQLGSSFRESSFFQFYNNILNCEKLLKSAEELHYQIQFLPHPNLQSYLSEFKHDTRVRFLDMSTKYRDVFAQSNLFVTDYSSAVFDFAYLRKPIVYCHFDAPEFFSGKHAYTKGYFSYEQDGFGEVEYNFDDTVDRIIDYMKCGCQLKEKYQSRIDRFFAFNDQRNCQRVYEAIEELHNRG